MRLSRFLFTAKAALLALALLGAPAHAQNSICPDVATGDSSNRCANTRFVLNQILASGLIVGSTVVGGGTNPYILYNNNGILGNLPVTGTAGNVVLSSGPSILNALLTTPNIGVATGTSLSLSGVGSTAPFYWDDTLKKLNLNISGTAVAAAETDTQFQMDGADGFATTIFMDSHGATAAIDFRQQGGTKASPTATATGATMGQINFQGWDGTAYGKNARVRAIAEPSGATWTLTDHGVGVGIFTTAPGTTSLSEKFHVFGNGGIATAGLASQGAGTLNLAALYANNTLIIDSSGNVTAPTVTSAGAVTTGTVGGTTGTIIAKGSGSGTVTVTAQAAAGTPAIAWPTTSGTLTTTGTSPIVVNATTGAISCPTCNTTGANVSTVSNADGTLTISPTSGAVVASVALSHANTWLSTQTFPSPVITGHPTIEGVVSTGATGTGKFVFDTGATVALAAATITAPLPLTSGGTGNTTESYHYIETLTASASATLTTSAFTSAFDDYLFIIDNIVPVTDNVGFNLTVESGGSFQATTYLNSVATTTSIDISTVSTISNVAGKGYSGQILLHNVNSTSVNKTGEGRGMFLASGGTTVTAAGAGGFWNGGQGAVTRGRFQMTSGNISSGTIKVIGIRNN